VIFIELCMKWDPGFCLSIKTCINKIIFLESNMNFLFAKKIILLFITKLKYLRIKKIILIFFVLVALARMDTILSVIREIKSNVYIIFFNVKDLD
jgi:hypothetical protein